MQRKKTDVHRAAGPSGRDACTTFVLPTKRRIFISFPYSTKWTSSEPTPARPGTHLFWLNKISNSCLGYERMCVCVCGVCVCDAFRY